MIVKYKGRTVFADVLKNFRALTLLKKNVDTGLLLSFTMVTKYRRTSLHAVFRVVQITATLLIDEIEDEKTDTFENVVK